VRLYLPRQKVTSHLLLAKVQKWKVAPQASLFHPLVYLLQGRIGMGTLILKWGFQNPAQAVKVMP